MVVNPPLIVVSALFFLALSSGLYLASWLTTTVVLRLGRRLSHRAQKRLLMSALVLPPLLAAVPTVGGATFRHSYARPTLEHHSMLCQQMFGRLLTVTQVHGSALAGLAVNGAAWLILLVGVVFLSRLIAATARLELGLEPYLLRPSPKLSNALESISNHIRPMPTGRFFECAIPAAYSSVFGMFRVRCVLSQEFVRSATDAELAAMVAHETSHMRSFDLQSTLVVGALNCVFFAIRPVRLLSRRWREAAELACDDAAVSITNNPLAMASAILRVSGIPVSSAMLSRPLPATTLAFASEAACSPTKRVERLLAQAQSAALSPPVDKPLPAAAMWTVTMLLAGLGIAMLVSPEAECYAHCSLETVAHFLP